MQTVMEFLSAATALLVMVFMFMTSGAFVAIVAASLVGAVREGDDAATHAAGLFLAAALGAAVAFLVTRHLGGAAC